MFDYPAGSIVAGVAFLLAGSFALIRVFLLEPGSNRYPKAPRWLRYLMFLMSSVMLLYGMQYIWVYFRDLPNATPPQASMQMQFLAVCLAIYKGGMLLNILRQRFPEEIWLRLNRIHESLPCRGGRFSFIWSYLAK